MKMRCSSKFLVEAYEKFRAMQEYKELVEQAKASELPTVSLPLQIPSANDAKLYDAAIPTTAFIRIMNVCIVELQTWLTMRGISLDEEISINGIGDVLSVKKLPAKGWRANDGILRGEDDTDEVDDQADDKPTGTTTECCERKGTPRRFNPGKPVGQ